MRSLTNRLDKAMTQEQFTQVVDAILNGKYSWACVLILQFAGYNPLHYIPYRTYNRLMKENRLLAKDRQSDAQDRDQQTLVLQNCLTHLEDLGHLETLHDSSAKIEGGIGITLSSHFYLTSWN